MHPLTRAPLPSLNGVCSNPTTEYTDLHLLTPELPLRPHDGAGILLHDAQGDETLYSSVRLGSCTCLPAANASLSWMLAPLADDAGV